RSGKSLDGGGQAALVASGLVLVDDVLVSHAIDDAGGLAEDFVGSCLVAGVDGLANTLDRGTQHGTDAGVVFVAGHCLAGALASLCGISHMYLLSFKV